jgi:outer membrane protein insertion porin family
MNRAKARCCGLDAAATTVSLRVVCALASCLSLVGVPAAAQDGPIITELRVEQEGRPVTDPDVIGLISTTVGRPYSMQAVRRSWQHLDALNRFDDIVVAREDAGSGIRLVYRLVPRRPIDRLQFRGMLGLDEADLRRELRDQYGTAPPESRVPQAVERLQQFYLDHGFPSARVTPSLLERPEEYRKTLVLTVDAGPRALVTAFDIDQDAAAPGMPASPELRTGRPYDVDEIRKTLDRYVADLREKGFYGATAQAGTPRFGPEGVVVPIFLRRGRRVRVTWEGDPISKSDQERLVPVRREASVDETLLEDWTLAIETDLRAQGYRDVAVERRSSLPSDPELVITFSIKKGPRYLVSRIVFTGQKYHNELELRDTLGLKEGQPFMQLALAVGLSRVVELYRADGFQSVSLKPDPAVVLPEHPSDGTRGVNITVVVNEGARRVVRSVAFDGVTPDLEPRLREVIAFGEGAPFSEAELHRSRDDILFDYRDRGYLDVSVPQPLLTTAPEGGETDILFRVVEGPQIVVDRFIIEGNERTSRRTIERELTLAVGQPFGERLRIDSEARLRALGLFRRVRIDARRHKDDDRADAVVIVVESPPRMIGGGGGLEISSRLRTIEEGVVEERLEVAPRGFLEMGRRNMWGKNRSVTGFARVSAKAEDELMENGEVRSSYGINEYRIFATYREPRVFDTRFNALITGIGERVIRPSYGFETIEARAELLGSQVGNLNGAVRFSIENTDLFGIKVPPEELPLIDRLFPDVRLSKVSLNVVRNTRNDELNPSRGTFMSADGEFAARAIGSEVGYVKGFVQGIWYRQMPVPLRTVVVLRGILGAAHGFARAVAQFEPDGTPVLDGNGDPLIETVQDLPASERFFAGGSTTNRGFTDDRLGNEDTITEAGYPLGGNGEIILNGEVRVGILRSVAGVAFVDAGNIFKRAADLSFTNLRPAAGFGVHYYSRYLPVRVELGFNLDRRELSPGTGAFERGHVLHVSLGPAF